MNIRLKMPTTEDESMSGINDGNIETFRNQMMMSLTKEELQNSTDNAIKTGSGEPARVTVEFHDYYLPTSDLPDIDTLLQVFNTERSFWDSYMTQDKKVVHFLDKAISLLKKPKIRCLRISDFNTTGLTGVKAEGASPWNNLVRNRGVSDKPMSATGSFGIGKDAAFACSDIRAVFYSTYNIDPSDNKAFQGTLKLPTYRKDGINYTGFGSFASADSVKGAEPIMECLSLDADYQRTDFGMDKYIMGFLDDLSQEDLKREIVASSIDNFLCAFWEDRLVLKYEDVIVDREHLDEIVGEYKDYLSKVTIDYYETLKNPDSSFSISVLEPDDVTIYVRLMENADRRAAIVRKSGMKVFDKTRINKRIEFAAVVVLTGDKANGYFKNLENPEHTGWAIDRASDKKDAKEKQNKIFDALREAVNALQQANATDAIDADGVNEYLPFTYITGKKKKIEGLSNEVEETRKAKKKKKKKDPVVEQSETITYEEDEQGNIIETTITVTNGTEGGSGTGSDGDGDNNGNGEGAGDGEGGTGDKGDGGSSTREEEGEVTATAVEGGRYIAKRKVPNSNFQFIMKITDNVYHLKIIGTKDVRSGFAEIRVSSEAETFISPLASAYVDGQKTPFSVNKILFDGLTANVKHDISFTFKHEEIWAVEVSICEN